MVILYIFYDENGDGVILMVNLIVDGEVYKFSDGVEVAMVVLWWF